MSPSDGATAQPSNLTVKEQNALIAWRKTQLSEQYAVIAGQKTKLSFQRAVIATQQNSSSLQLALLEKRKTKISLQKALIAKQEDDISEQGALLADQKATISEQDDIIADMADKVTNQETALSQRDIEIAELKKQLEHEREQNLENTQRIKVMMENGHPPSQPTPAAQADTEAVAELRQELQRSKDWVQHLNRVINALGAKLAERDTHIAKQNEEIAKLDIEFEKLGTQIWQLKENKQEMEHILELINANAKKTEERLTALTMLQFCRDMEDKK